MENTSRRVPKSDIKYSVTLSEEQKRAKELILERPINFLMGMAGSGKTMLAVQVALDLYFKRKVQKIIITRPTVSTEDNGFLPGSEKEKMEPWLVPIRSNMFKVYNKPDTIHHMENEMQIEWVSLTHFRGRTFENAICIIDEFQNLTKQQLKMCLSRLGVNSTIIFTGDNQQIDLRYKNDSAVHSVPLIANSKYVNVITLRDNHRHPALDEILTILNTHS